MNKILQIGLVSAIMATSGFAATTTITDSTVEAGSEIKYGNNSTLSGSLTVEGTVENYATMTVEDGGKLLITESEYYPMDSLKLTKSVSVSLSSLTSSNVFKYDKTNAYWEFVTSTGEKVPHQGDTWSQSNYETSGGYFTNIKDVYVSDFDSTNLDYNISVRDDYTVEGENPSSVADVILTLPGSFSQGSTAVDVADDATYTDCLPTNGVLDLTDATGAAANFIGTVSGGSVKLSDKNTAGNFTGMTLDDVVGVYEYNENANDTLSTVANGSNEIEVKNTNATDDPEDEFLSKFASESALTTTDGVTNFYSIGYAGEPQTDDRLTFAGLLDHDLNVSGNTLPTGNLAADSNDSALQEITIDETYGKVLDVKDATNPAISFNFSGSDNLKFTANSSTTLTFSGDNSGYTGSARFDSTIATITANGKASLPVLINPAVNSGSPVINLNIENGAQILGDGTNDQVIFFSNLNMEEGTSLTIKSGTTVLIGMQTNGITG